MQSDYLSYCRNINDMKKQKEYDYLIVGAGLYGAVFAYRANKAGKKCLVIDKRAHIGGNVYCENICGINVHKYGAHIFHTSNKAVWEFVNSIVDFNRYTNSPIAVYKDKLYNLPFNMNTFYNMWQTKTPESTLKVLETQRKEAVDALGGRSPENLEEQATILVGKDIYEILIKGYTEKQWGRPCNELPPFIIKRLPVRLTFDNNYFNDKYQGIPIGGYNILIERLLEGIETRLNCNFFDNRSELEGLADKIVYTGPIDEYFNFVFGQLEYRTVCFETESLTCPNFQGNAVVNYTDRDIPYTRIIEHKHFEMFGNDVYSLPMTVISKEYSTEWKPGLEPYYPINDERNTRLFAKYKSMASDIDNVIFGGRLADYQYYDMDAVIWNALNAKI